MSKSLVFRRRTNYPQTEIGAAVMKQDVAPPAPLFPAGLAGYLATDDFDEMAAAGYAWKNEYTKLSSTPFNGSQHVAHTGRLQLGTHALSDAIAVRGSLPSSCRAFVMPLATKAHLWHRGHALNEHDLALLKPEDGLEMHCQGALSVQIITVDLGLLETQAAGLLGDDWQHDLEADFLSLSPAAHQRLSHLLPRLTREAIGNPVVLTDPATATRLEEEVMDVLLASIAHRPAVTAPPAARARLARRAAEFLSDSPGPPSSVRELCGALGVHERLLELAFRHYFGMTPRTYLRNLRLHKVRRELLTAGPTETVTTIATHLDFFHLGRFPQQYRKLFGELPSQTLARSRTGCPGGR